jgi:hypothetical protein
MFPNGILNLWYSVKDTNEILKLKRFTIIIENEPIVLFIDDKELKENCFKIDFQYFIDRIREAKKQSSATDFKDFGEKIGHFKKEDSYINKNIKDFKYAEPFFDLLNSGQLILGLENGGVPDEFIKEDPKNLNGAKIDIEKTDLLKIQSQLMALFKEGIWTERRISVFGTIDWFFRNFSRHLEEQIIEIFNNDEILKLKYENQIFTYLHPTNSLNPDSDRRPYIKPELHWLFEYVKKLLKDVFSNFSNSWEDVSYLPSIRAKNERLYMVSKEGYAIQEFDQKAFERIDFKNETINKFYSDVLKDFEIGENIEIKTYQRTATEITIIRNGRKMLLSDLGFGYAQLIPIIFTILTTAEKWRYWSYKDESDYTAVPSPIILIEEPESNLHPDFQAKLADMFVKASNLFGIQFIIETHSEYLIRRLQYLTAKKEISPKDVSIYYFNNPEKIPNGEKQVNKIEIRSDGILKQDFGSGFYDQATNSTYDLFRLINEN